MKKLPPDLILEVARRVGLEPRKVGQHEHAVRCPRRENHRSGDMHPSCRLNDQKGVFHCDVCGLGGGILEFARLLGVDLSSLSSFRSSMPKAARRTTRRELLFGSLGPISETTQALFGTSLGKHYTAEAWKKIGVLEGTVDGEPAIAFSMPSGGYKACHYRRPNPKRNKPYTFLFTDGGKADLLTVGDDKDVLLVAGEWDMLAALSAGIPCVATGTGGEGTWKREWSARLKGKRVFIAYDVDEAGRLGAEKVLSSLSSAATEVYLIRLPLSGNNERDGKDLSDFLAIHSVDELRTLISNAARIGEESARSVDTQTPSIAEAIDFMLSMDIPLRIRRREAAKLVIDDLRKHGELVRTIGGRLFWFDRDNQLLHDMDAFSFRSLFLKVYQVNPAEREYAHIFEAVKSVARNEGRSVHICRFSFYDRTNNRLYVHGGRGFILCLDGSTIQRVDNGTDDVLFEEQDDVQTIPVEALDLTIEGDPLLEHVTGRINFIRGRGVILSPEQQRLVLRVWILSVFFTELLPAKCLLLMYGEKGSGKSTTLRVILKLLLGPQANVTPLVNKEDGFNAAVTTEFLLVLDNVDSHCRWIEDRLATVATGQTIRLRKLYTTNEMLSFPTRCCIALTARTPRFRRDDVVDRLQILRVARLEEFSKESDWYAEIEDHRAQLWAQILRDLDAVVAFLRAASTDTPDTIRMADWAFVATTIGETL